MEGISPSRDALSEMRRSSGGEYYVDELRGASDNPRSENKQPGQESFVPVDQIPDQGDPEEILIAAEEAGSDPLVTFDGEPSEIVSAQYGFDGVVYKPKRTQVGGTSVQESGTHVANRDKKWAVETENPTRARQPRDNGHEKNPRRKK